MANIKSQIKRNRKNEAQRVRNKGVRTELKTRVKSATEGGDAEVREAQKRLDMAAARGAIHKNAAARRKSRLVKAARKAGQPS